MAKTKALMASTIENLNRHGKYHWIHASLGKGREVVTRRLENRMGLDLTIRIYTNLEASLIDSLPRDPRLEIVDVKDEKSINIPKIASQRLLESSNEFDILGYMEDDILIEDPEFFNKIRYLHANLPEYYSVIPHRCEHIPGKGDVILSGDPDGGRPDLFWDTKEKIRIKWPSGEKELYRATNPHSGCFFINQAQGRMLLEHWQKRNWKSPFELSGPLEQAASGRLIEKLRIMKPMPEDYKFLMVRHVDELWKRHRFE